MLTLVASQTGGAHQAQNLITKIYENMGKDSTVKKRKRYVMATKAQLGDHRQQKSFDSPLNQLSKTITLIRFFEFDKRENTKLYVFFLNLVYSRTTSSSRGNQSNL